MKDSIRILNDFQQHNTSSAYYFEGLEKNNQNLNSVISSITETWNIQSKISLDLEKAFVDISHSNENISSLVEEEEKQVKVIEKEILEIKRAIKVISENTNKLQELSQNIDAENQELQDFLKKFEF